jgi:hypothetical protein
MYAAAMPTSRSETSASNLWPLLSMIAAIIMWWGADELRQRVRETDVQLASAAKRVSRGSAQEVSAQQDEARRVEVKRRNLAERLASGESEQMTRAKLVFDLRQKCHAVPLVCQVRLADLSSAESLRQRATDTAGELSLETLGISRARAVLSGNFKSGELLGLYTTFAQDVDAQWKINALVVKGNSFELDVERLILRQTEKAQP